MEDEILKYTKKIYAAAKNNKHSFWEKVKEIVIEILIIVFAVTISIWFHNWNEHKHEQTDVQNFLKGLKEDVNKEIESLKEYKQTAKRLDSNYIYFLALDKSKLKMNDSVEDKQLTSHLRFSIPVTQPHNGRYEGFKSSGKIENIENDSLKKNILVFFQQTLPDLIYAQNYINSVQLKIIDFQYENDEKTSISHFVTSKKLQSYFSLAHFNFEVCVENYDDAIEQAQRIIKDIEMQEKNKN